jgi:HEAT repeat protein
VILLVAGLATLAATAGGFIGFGALHDWHRRQTEERIAVARRALAQLLLSDSNGIDRSDLDDLLRAPTTARLSLFQDVAVDLGDAAYQRLRAIVQASGAVSRIHRLGRVRSWRRRIQAAELQALLADNDPVRFSLLQDPHPLVRARAAESLTRVDVVDHLDQLLTMLDDASDAVRLGAQQALLRGDARIAEGLATYLWEDSRPGTTLALEVATNLPDPRYGPVMRHHAGHPDPARRAMVARGLGAGAALVGLPVLHALFEDPDAEVRAAAATAAAATRALEFVAPLGRLLSDPSWIVRREAGVALDALGPAGSVMLRAQLFADDRFARDMARQVLDAAAARHRRPRVLGPEDLPSLDVALGAA